MLEMMMMTMPTVRLGMQIVMCVYNLGSVWKIAISFKLRREEWRMERRQDRTDEEAGGSRGFAVVPPHSLSDWFPP
jgi:hypothetical protein